MKKYLFICLITSILMPAFTHGHTAAATQIAETRYMEFHSHFLVNLHHFIFKKAIRYSFYKSPAQRQFDTLFQDLKTPVSTDIKNKVMTCIQFYSDSLVKRNMLFDETLTSFKYALQQSSNINELKTRSSSRHIIEALASVEHFYRDFFWETHNSNNKSFIYARLDMIKKTEQIIMDLSAEFYKYKHNGKKFRVDICDYATFFGAYTTTTPYVSATISSSDKRHTGSQGIEVIFHEISHSMIDTVFNQQMAICSRFNIPFDHNIWHSILFYSTGCFVKQALAVYGETHELYMYKNKITDFNPGIKKTSDAVALYWQEYLEHKIDMQKALELILGQNN